MKIAIAAVAALTCLAITGDATAADLQVTSPADAVDASPGDGRCASADGGCTLRAAVQEAARASGPTTIRLPAGRFRLDISPVPGAGSIADTDPANGDLDLAGRLVIQGAGAGRTIVDGGGVDRVFETNFGATVRIADLTVTGGDSTAGNSQEIDLGGGILNKAAIELDRVELTGNRADGGGGMFSIPGTMPVVRDSLITDNSAYSGGGLRIDHGGRIVNTTISGNRLLSVAGDAIQTKPVAISTLLVDEISGWGGGIDHRGGADLTIESSTITGNHAVKGGGGIGAGQGYAPLSEHLPLGHLILRDTIVAGNDSAAGPAECRTNQVGFRSLGHNLAGDRSCYLTAVGDQPATRPMLAPLADNGGPTRTLALLPGSPAIDGAAATGCPAADARGVPRPQGRTCDIGAFEAVPTAARCTVRLPTGLVRRARSFDVLVSGRVVARGRRPRRSVTLPAGSPRRVTLRVHRRSGGTVRVVVRSACRAT